MEDYIGKICPFCKTEIKEGDAVKVCPSCGIPHHEACWEENKGCTTFGCSEQHYEEQHTNPTDVCVNCGAPLGDGQEFCPKGGTPKGGKKKRVCAKCGAELQDGQKFCPKCGQKADLQIDAGVNSAISQFNAGVAKTNEKAKKKGKTIGIIAAVAVVVAVLAIFLAPKIFVSVDDLCAQGNYEKAYTKASEKEKVSVVAENVIAVLSEESSDWLKDPSSFVLRDGYHYGFINDDGKLGGYAVLYLSGNNSYGASISNYWLYIYDQEDGWEYWDSYDTTSADSDDEVWDTLCKSCIKTAMSDGYKLSKDQVKRINTMFEDDTLYKVVLMDNESIDTALYPDD